MSTSPPTPFPHGLASVDNDAVERATHSITLAITGVPSSFSLAFPAVAGNRMVGLDDIPLGGERLLGSKLVLVLILLSVQRVRGP